MPEASGENQMSAFSYSLDDSSGEALGAGLDSSAVDLSGADYSYGVDDTLQGSSLDLGGVGDTGGVTDVNSLEDQFNLSGVSDPMQSDFLDSGLSDTNGAGSAASTHPLTFSSPDHVSTLFSGLSKFGFSIGQLFAAGSARQQPNYTGGVSDLYSNRSPLRGVSRKNALLGGGVNLVLGG